MNNSVKFGIKFFLIALVSPVVFLGAALAGNSVWEQVELGRLQQAIGDLPHPTKSTFLARHGEVGTIGNGHHTDHWVVELRSFTGAKSAHTAYDGQRVAVPNYGEDTDDDASQDIINGKQPIEWDVLPSPLPPRFRLTARGYGDGWDLSRFAGKRGLYIVQVINSGHAMGY